MCFFFGWLCVCLRILVCRMYVLPINKIDKYNTIEWKIYVYFIGTQNNNKKIHDQNGPAAKKNTQERLTMCDCKYAIGARVYFSRMYGEKQIQKASHPPGPIAVSLLKQLSMCCIVQWLAGWLLGLCLTVALSPNVCSMCVCVCYIHTSRAFRYRFDT